MFIPLLNVQYHLHLLLHEHLGKEKVVWTLPVLKRKHGTCNVATKTWCVSFLSYHHCFSKFRPIIRNSSLNSIVYVRWYHSIYDSQFASKHTIFPVHPFFLKEISGKTMFFFQLPTSNLDPPTLPPHLGRYWGHACGEVLLLGTHGIRDVEWCTRTWTWSAVVQTQGAAERNRAVFIRSKPCGGKGGGW